MVYIIIRTICIATPNDPHPRVERSAPAPGRHRQTARQQPVVPPGDRARPHDKWHDRDAVDSPRKHTQMRLCACT